MMENQEFTPREISKTKRDIMSKAAELFAERGFGSVGISEVGEMANLGKGSLYYHIGSKEELLYSIMTEYMVQLIATGRHIIETQSDSRARIEKLSSAFMETMFHSQSAMTVCFREVHSLGFDKRDSVLSLHGDYQRIWEQTFTVGHERGECRAVSRLETKAMLGMYFYSFLWVRSKGPSSSEEIAKKFSNIVLAAVVDA